MVINGAEIIYGLLPVQTKYLLVAGGREPDTVWLQAASEGRTVVCADKGVCYCQKAGVRPDYLIGDGDSAGEGWQWASENGVAVDTHPRDKDETDLQLALHYIAQQDKNAEILITGVWGGRFDHSYVNVYSALAAAEKLSGPVVLSDERETLALMPRSGELTAAFTAKPEVITILPFTDRIKVSITGTQWEIKEKTVEKSNIYTISNRLKQGCDFLKISLFSGQAGVYFLMKN